MTSDLIDFILFLWTIDILLYAKYIELKYLRG